MDDDLMSKKKKKTPTPANKMTLELLSHYPEQGLLRTRISTTIVEQTFQTTQFIHKWENVVVIMV